MSRKTKESISDLKLLCASCATKKEKKRKRAALCCESAVFMGLVGKWQETGAKRGCAAHR